MILPLLLNFFVYYLNDCVGGAVKITLAHGLNIFLSVVVELFYCLNKNVLIKVVIVDDEFVTTGSTNFDFRSFEHNFEFNALVYSKEFNRKMKDIFEADLQRCSRVSMGKWKQRPLIQKALESVVRLLSPIL